MTPKTLGISVCQSKAFYGHSTNDGGSLTMFPEECLSIFQSTKNSSTNCILEPLHYSESYHNYDDEIKRLIEMAEIAEYCHNLTPIKAFTVFHVVSADNALKRLIWRFLFFDSPPKRSGRGMVRTIAIRGGLK